MKIIKDPAFQRRSPDEKAYPFEDVAEAIRQQVPPDNRDIILALARELRMHTPRAFYSMQKPEKVARWVVDIFDFIKERREDVAIELKSARRSGQWFLMTNTPDASFLVDSLQLLFRRFGIRFQIVSHPILRLKRQRKQLKEVVEDGRGGSPESLILAEVQGLRAGVRARFEQALRECFTQVLQIHAAQRRLKSCLKKIETLPEAQQVREFWHWLQDGNFIPFGYRCLRIESAPQQQIQVSIETSEGIFCTEPDGVPGTQYKGEDLDAASRRRLERNDRIVVEETAGISTVHRDDHLTYLGWREELGDGVYQEHAFCGLFSQRFLEEPTFSIPVLRKRIEQALVDLGIPRGSHDYSKAIEIFNTFPKVELFFMEPEELREAARSFTFLYRQDAVKVVPAPSLSVDGRTLLLILPREFYQRENIDRIKSYVRRFFQAQTVTSRIVQMLSDYLSLHVRVAPRGEKDFVDLRRLEMGLTEIARPWEAKLRIVLESRLGDEKGRLLFDRYIDGLSSQYRTLTHPRYALRDIEGMEEVRRTGGEHFSIWGPFHNGDESEEYYRLQFYSRNETYLNSLMPLLENLNLCVIDELDFTVNEGSEAIYIKSFAIKNGDKRSLPLGEVRDKLLGIVTALRKGQLDNDYLNRLLVLTGLDGREIDVFRAYRNYYHQLGSPFTKRRVAFALINNSQVALLLFRYFQARFEPRNEWREMDEREEKALMPLRMELAEALEQVSDINEDRILRTLFNLIDSTVRTNFFLRRDEDDYFFSFKISAIGIIDMPAPRPLFEIYVHSALMEGIHLRGGKVARGGIRWSDRPDDFRTEVLGLMKTQMTKNALIVPVGSKGGFIVHSAFNTREQGAELSKAAYITLMRGLLDLTDNRVKGEVVRPAGLIAYDEEDPYLVVAADKGTAHLPDTANAVSAEYNYWLADAFASGGSRGYDHKELGITARGAWECVKRHFREMDVDIQTEPFTVIGIGDMSGDVFGNGMLLSRKIKLLAAFDHRNIFLDPDPDPEVSFKERQRLFELPRSSWEDYDKTVISEGGGVFSRQAKDIPLSEPVRRMLGTRHRSVDAQGLVRLILQAEVDLFWNGGIGTYVKASGEKNEDVGDRSNDGVRIDANQLRVKVVGEGGNLGMTQKARIEFAVKGGRINTDAIDNSAGVDCSDHEVNLKIFMQRLREMGRVKDDDERDRVLSEVTDQVCDAVLHNNYMQSLSISLDQRGCARNIEPYLQLIDRLVNAGLLDRAGEFLPTTKEVLARPKKSLTRPELAILLAYAKMQLYHTLLESSLCEDGNYRDDMRNYFPAGIRERYLDELDEHPLCHQITATVLTNTIVDTAGCARMSLLARQTGRPLFQCAGMYLTFDRILEGDTLREAVFALDNRMAAEEQYRIIDAYAETLQEMCFWALQQDTVISLDDEALLQWQERIGDFINALPGVTPSQDWEKAQQKSKDLSEAGLEASLSQKVAALPYLGDSLPLFNLVEKTQSDLHDVACAHRDLMEKLGVSRLRTAVAKVPLRDRWDRMALDALEKDLSVTLFRLTEAVLRETDGNVERYLSRRRQKYRALNNLWQQVQGTEPVNFNPFMVIGRALADLL